MFQTISSTGSSFPTKNAGPRMRRSIEHNSNSNIFDAAKFVPVAPRSEVQRLSLEYERQRHLANWIIESNAYGFNQRTDKNETKKMKKPLRRFNSHDSTNLMSVQISCADQTEPEIPLKKKQSLIKRLSPFESTKSDHSNSLESNHELKKSTTGSSGSSSKFKTGSSKNSATNNEDTADVLKTDLKHERVIKTATFLERYSLPRVVRVNEGPPAMLYRHLPGHAVVQARVVNGKGRSGRGLRIPRGYQGWFSVIGERGETLATSHPTIMHLVRERVYKFVSAEAIVAYTETPDNDSGRAHYVRSTVRAGQVFRLLAVFQDGAEGNMAAGKDAERGQYAQLLGDNKQVVYVSLSTKGKFFEIAPVSHLGGPPTSRSLGVTPLNKDSVHRLSTILSSIELPITVKLIAGPLPDNLTTDHSDNLVLQSMSFDPVLVTCSLSELSDKDAYGEYRFHKISLKQTSDSTLSRCLLGFESEQRLFQSTNIQAVLNFCHNNFENWFRQIEVTSDDGTKNDTIANKQRNDGLKFLKTSHFARFLRGEKHIIPHEKEDSIIFLSKHDLQGTTDSSNLQKDLHSEKKADKMPEMASKMKVFEPSKRTKWFKHFKILSNNEKDYKQEITDKYREYIDPFDPEDKRQSIERYQDMAKLIEERFGKKCNTNSAKKSSSFIFPDRNNINKSLLKSHSVSIQNIDCTATEIGSAEEIISAPDLIPVEDFDKIQRYEDIKKQAANRTSFITEKLCAEFHVKTKQLSKSTSSLNQILHFSVPQKMNITERRKDQDSLLSLNETMTRATVHTSPKEEDHDKEERIIDIQSRKLPVIDDMPYSDVKDAIAAEEVNDEMKNKYNENIYAEICDENVNFENGLFLNSHEQENDQDNSIMPNDVTVVSSLVEVSSDVTNAATNVKKYVSETSIKIQVTNEDTLGEVTCFSIEDEGYVRLKDKEVQEAIYNTLK